MTIYDIATKARVSISTVSRVLNDPSKVREATRKHVLAVLEKYNYTPSAVARGLVCNSMNTIGVMTPDVRNPHFAQTTYTIENDLFNWGFSVLLCNTGNKREKKKDYLRILAEKKIDGAIFVGSVFTEINIESDIKRYLPATPIVVANGVIDLPQAHSVLIDHDRGMNLAVGHLKERGHRDIVLIRNTRSYNSLKKIEGFRRAMSAHDLPMDDESIIESSLGYHGGIDAMDQLLAKDKAFSGLIFCDDASALAGMNRLWEKGFSIPGDVAIIGYDETDCSLFARPQLTSVDIKVHSFSSIVANTLHDILLGKEVGTSIKFAPELMVRQST